MCGIVGQAEPYVHLQHGASAGGMLALVIFVATFAKLIGCGIGAKLSGLCFREAATVGILMNTRG